ncbi:MAG TPA: pitrilysin family protein [Gemmatimonadota bacterium]|nr:pitrilysin family protein [Gemmatimonadota bacterium]
MRARWGGLAALLIAAAPLAAQQQLPIHTTTLDNGLDVIVIENHAVPLVTIELDVKNGAYTETPDYNGLSHLYEHMFFKANRTIPSQEEYLERVNELGATWNGTTSTERVNYYITVGLDSLEPAVQFMEDAIRHPLFDQAELERERPVVLGEYDRNESNPFFHLGRATDTLLWSPEYYSRKNVIGDRQVIITTTQEKMRTIQERFYVPNNTALILSGDITPERGFELAERVFADWPRGGDPFATPIADPPPLTQPRAVIVEQPVNTVTVSVGWQGPSVTRDVEATYVADLLATALANPTSKFYKALVESGLAFGVGFSYYTQMHVGPISIQAQTTPDKALELHRAILAEVEKFDDPGYVTDAELDAAKSQVGVAQVYGREQASSFAHTVGFWWAVAGLDYYLGYVDGMQRVSQEDIAGLARGYMMGKPHVSGVLIDPESRAAIDLTASDLLAQEVIQ